MPRFQRLPSSREPSIWDAYQGEYPAITAWPAPTYQYWYPYPFTSPVVNPPTGTTAAEQKSPAEKLANPEGVGTPPSGGASAPFLPAASGGMQSPAAANPMASVLPPAVEGAFDASPSGGEGGAGSVGGPSSLSHDSPVSAISLGQALEGTPGQVTSQALSMVGTRMAPGAMIPSVSPIPGLALEGVRGIFSNELQRAGINRLGEMEGELADLSLEAGGPDEVGGFPMPVTTPGTRGFSAPSPTGPPGGIMRASEQAPVIPSWGSSPEMTGTGFALPGGGFAMGPAPQNTTNAAVNIGGPAAAPPTVTEGFLGVEPDGGRMGDIGLPSLSDPGPAPPSDPAPDLGMGFDFGGGVDAGGGGGGGGGTVICTALHRRGWLSDAALAANHAYSRRMGKDAYQGYLRWATPLVAWSTKTPRRARVVWAITRPLVRAYVQQIAYEVGEATQGSMTGKVLLALGVPISRWLGRTRPAHAPAPQ